MDHDLFSRVFIVYQNPNPADDLFDIRDTQAVENNKPPAWLRGNRKRVQASSITHAAFI
jgi:hypothetical protein